jgi:hypothetical protein
VAGDALCDREVTLYGFLRGAPLKPGARAHLAGVGDYPVSCCWTPPSATYREELCGMQGSPQA